MSIEEITRWFANGYRRMHMKTRRGDYTFYPCEDGPTCPWPPCET